MLNATLSELSEALQAKKISSVELTKLHLGRIARLDKGLNAFITVDESRALADAQRADERRAKGEAGLLLGIPVAHKDIFCTKGLLTTCGSKMLANFVSPYDAHVIERFEAAGAVLLGKCNMDEYAMGSSTETSHFGPARNPWDARAVPGGSSGGSAAAVAARMAPAATGTDTGGSIRQPASFSGVSGLKPTYGTVSRYGIVAFASSLDQAGPLGKSAADLALMMNVMAGFDARDSTSLDRPKEDYLRELGLSLSGMRIGLPREYFSDGVDEGVRSAVEEAIRWYERQGAKTVQVGSNAAKVDCAGVVCCCDRHELAENAEIGCRDARCRSDGRDRSVSQRRQSGRDCRSAQLQSFIRREEKEFVFTSPGGRSAFTKLR